MHTHDNSPTPFVGQTKNPNQKPMKQLYITNTHTYMYNVTRIDIKMWQIWQLLQELEAFFELGVNFLMVTPIVLHQKLQFMIDFRVTVIEL